MIKYYIITINQSFTFYTIKLKSKLNNNDIVHLKAVQTYSRLILENN